ncbi:MAG: CPBP family intramembrane metalloprotease [Butyrivibrio sp.]|nr:CPBP family intramembrane metalloprotease [Butyrivibrio sp.]
MKNYKFILVAIVTLLLSMIPVLFIPNLVGAIIQIIILTIPIFAFGQIKIFAFSFKSFFATFVVGGVMTIATAYYMINSIYKGIHEFGSSAIDSKTLILFIIFLFITAGMQEELLTRGFFNTFLRKGFGNTKASYIAATAISSIFFGLYHLTNLMSGNDPEAIYSQTIYAIGVGFFLGALYIRTGNLWGNMVLHFLFDFAVMIYPILFAKMDVATQKGDMIKAWLGEGIVVKSIILTVAAFALGLFLIRDSKLKPIIEAEEREEMAA